MEFPQSIIQFGDITPAEIALIERNEKMLLPQCTIQFGDITPMEIMLIEHDKNFSALESIASHTSSSVASVQNDIFEEDPIPDSVVEDLPFIEEPISNEELMEIDRFEKEALQTVRDSCTLSDYDKEINPSNNGFQCNICGNVYNHKHNMLRHRRSHSSIRYHCAQCSSTFTRQDYLTRHTKRKHNTSTAIKIYQSPKKSRNVHSDKKKKMISYIESTPHNVTKNILTEVPMQKVDEVQSFQIGEGNHNAAESITAVAGPSTVNNSFECDICGNMYTYRHHMLRHRKCHSSTRYPCTQCSSTFTRQDYLTRHMKRKHDLVSIAPAKVNVLPQKRKNISLVTAVPTKKHRKPSCPNESRRSVNTFSVHSYIPEEECNKDLMISMANLKQSITVKLEEEIDTQQAIKWYINVTAQFSRLKEDGDTEKIEAHFRSKCVIALSKDGIDRELERAEAKIQSSVEKFLERGSGWILDRIICIELKICRYRPLAASTYIPLPPPIANKQACINVQNKDKKCFIWSILAALHPVHFKDHPNRVSNYEAFENELNTEGITYPVSLHQIPKFEKLNNISINVFGYEDVVFPLHITKEPYSQHIDLLLISNGNASHYCLIKSLDRLLANLTKHKERSFYCSFCLHRYSRQDLLDDHMPYCSAHKPQRVVMPEENKNKLMFKNVQYQSRIPFTIYADFECIISKNSTCHPNPSLSSTTVVGTHEPCGYAYVIIGPNGKLMKTPKVYRGNEAVRHFLCALQEEESFLHSILSNAKPLAMSNEEELKFKEAINCHICTKILNDDRVRDHDHVTGEYRGAAHNKCNLLYRQVKKIPVIFHNLKNYDSHLLMQGIGAFKDRKIGCIANNREKFITFNLGSIQFLDSFQFLPASLSTLVSNLSRDKFTITKSLIQDTLKFDLLLRKGIYPYEYMDSFQRFNEESLPPQGAFYSTLTEETVSVDDYQHALKVWNAFKIRNLGEYHDLYVKADVLQLADIFENFRNLCLCNYGIDPCHVYTAPGLAWEACLKMTEVNLELITDPTMHLLIEKGIRGGISMISHRYSLANNKYLPNYDSTQASKYIMYYDANNLYGWAMSQYLPTGGFEWMDAGKITENDIKAVGNEDPIGYIYEVDLEYPVTLHDHHSDYPLAPEKMEIAVSMLSNYSITSAQKAGVKLSKTVPKLVPNLHDKNRYIIHYRNLKQYLQLGLKLKKVHRCLKFKQSPWLKSYIDFNTEKRKQAANTFEKDFFKLLNNSVFGKTMENLRNHIDIELVHTEKRAQKVVAAPAFKSFTIINENLTAVQRHKTKIVLNRPIFVGFSILDLSKTLMYDYHYNHMKIKYGNNLKLLFTDTDSLCYEITCDDIYQDMFHSSHLYDMSEYPTSHFLHSNINKKALGKFKDEMPTTTVQSFIGLRAKMYCLLTDEYEKKTAKGVKKSVREKHITFQQYKKALFENSRSKSSWYKLSSKNHQISTVAIQKTTLCALDDKRFILDDGIHTLAHGHFRIKQLIGET